MKNKKKTKDQLINELEDARQLIAEKEKGNARYRGVERKEGELIKELKSIFENIPFGIVYLNNKFRIISSNKFFNDFAGLQEEELKGKLCYEIVGEYSDDPTKKGPEKICSFCKKPECFKSKRPTIIERPLKDKFIRVTTIPELNKKGDISRFMEIVEDITERKKIEDVLQKAKDELEISVQERTIELKTSNVVLNREIAQRKEIEKALRQSQNELRLMYDAITDMLTVISPDYRICSTNKVVEKQFGKDLIGKVCYEVYQARNEICPDCPTRKAIDTKKPAHSFQPATKISPPVDIYAFPILDKEGEVIAIVEHGKDITERKKAEEELKRHQNHLQDLVKEQTTELTKTNEQLQLEIAEHKLAEERKAQLLEQVENINQELKDFAFIVSHDLKVPLRAINTIANWISTDYTDKLDEEGKEQLNLLVGRVHRMHALINGILEYSKLGRIKEKKVEVDLDEVLREVIDTIAPPGNINIRVEGGLPSIFCEKTRISEVFQNLLSNAVNYMDKPEGVVRIGCVEDDDFWKFNVSDNGPGIEEKYFEKIFQIFQTLSPVDEHESTGIGLTLVKKIITMYGGEIWIESEAGRGSSFCFTLPIKEDINA
ncbi:MAG: PAS domain-containing protein [Thermodesulfovibrionia bacterium]|nr:PAS domain-containing protein [Thermodesulfovibrionia bacterium]